MLGNPLLLGDDGYQISRSVRLRSSASAYFNWTPGSAGNRRTWTWSGWIKRGALTGDQRLFEAYAGTTSWSMIAFDATAQALRFEHRVAGTIGYNAITDAIFRDPSAWYHAVVAVDTTLATATNRVKIYVNGVLQTKATDTTTGGLNQDTYVNFTNAHHIGRLGSGSQYFDGYLTEVNFIDGQALTPSSFGETNYITGVWQPKKYTGTYGTNGFYLNFSDNSSNTATTIGKDYSGNGNNWTPNNISVTAGVTYDSMLDVPTPWGDGGNGRGNYAVLNPLVGSHANTYSNGNLKVATSTSNAAFSHQRATFAIPSSGKWYWEILCEATSSAFYVVGVAAETVNPDSQYVGQGDSYSYRSDTGQKATAGTFSSYGATFTTNDIIGVAFDADAGTLVFYKNGTSQGTAFSSISGTYFPAVADLDNNTGRNSTFTANFGQRPFAYTPPSGFKALNTGNLPVPTILKGNQYFDVVTRNGFGSSGGSITSLNFQPDLFWEKQRNGVSNHYLVDSVRGVSKNLYSDSTAAEGTLTTYVTSFNSNGYTMGSSDFATTATMVDWVWKAGGTSSSNTSGSITSTVSVGATQGFSIVKWTGDTTNATIGHGLGVAPKMIIRKFAGAVSDWPVYHANLTSAAYAIYLNTTAGQGTTVNAWNNTAPTSTVFSVGGVWNTAVTHIAYCFSEVAGFSKFGSYTGNGSTDGPFVFCGFRPRYVLLKRTDTTGNWGVWDTARDTFNAVKYELVPNASDAETTAAGDRLDILSNGFKLRNVGVAYNASGGTYIFAAFAEVPFRNSLAR